MLRGTVTAGQRVLVVAQDDHLPPLSVADHLSARGHDVTLTYATAGPAPLLGRYIVGGILARLFKRGVTFRFLEQVVAVTPGAVQAANVYSRQTEELTGFDSVVLACGGEADARLYEELAGNGPMYTCSATRSPPGGWSPRPGRRTPWPSSCSNKSSGGAGAGNRRATTPGPALPVRINGNIFPNERWCFFQLIRPR